MRAISSPLETKDSCPGVLRVKGSLSGRGMATQVKCLTCAIRRADMAEQVRVFFYGLFMDPDALEAKGLRRLDVRRAPVSQEALAGLLDNVESSSEASWKSEPARCSGILARIGDRIS